jgi:hypothetical protein
LSLISDYLDLQRLSIDHLSLLVDETLLLICLPLVDAELFQERLCLSLLLDQLRLQVLHLDLQQRYGFIGFEELAESF